MYQNRKKNFIHSFICLIKFSNFNFLIYKQKHIQPAYIKIRIFFLFCFFLLFWISFDLNKTKTKNNKHNGNVSIWLTRTWWWRCCCCCCYCIGKRKTKIKIPKWKHIVILCRCIFFHPYDDDDVWWLLN